MGNYQKDQVMGSNFSKDIFEQGAEEISSRRQTILVIIILLFAFLLIDGGAFLFHAYLKQDFNLKSIVPVALQSRGEQAESSNELFIKVTDTELNKSLKSQNFLHSAKGNIRKDGIELTGRTSANPLSLRILLLVMPRLENGKVKYEIKKMESAGLAVPKNISDPLAEKVNNSLNNVLGINEKTFSDLRLDDGQLILYRQIQ